MFDENHIKYMVITGLIGAVLIIPLWLLKNQNLNKAAIKFFALLTLAIQYSPLWIDFFTTGKAQVDADMLLAIYACNVCMWLLFISSLILEKNGTVAALIRDFTFWAGVVCGAVGTIFNINYGNNPDLSDYFILKGLLTHATMVYGSILLFTSGIVKIRVIRSTASVIFGMALFFGVGTAINALYANFGLPPCNSMYLLQDPFPDMPWINVKNIFLLAILTVIVISSLYRIITRNRTDE